MRFSVSGSGGTASGWPNGPPGTVPSGVPSATVETGIFSRAARRAISIGSLPSVVLPSESRTIAAGGRRARPLRRSVRLSRATSSASPVAVAPSAVRESSTEAIVSRSRVGRSTVCGVEENATSPTRICLGTWARNALAAVRAAARRSGCDVLGLHRARRVRDEHDRRLLDRDADRALRASERERERRHGQREQQGGDPPAPARGARR